MLGHEYAFICAWLILNGMGYFRYMSGQQILRMVGEGTVDTFKGRVGFQNFIYA